MQSIERGFVQRYFSPALQFIFRQCTAKYDGREQNTHWLVWYCLFHWTHGLIRTSLKYAIPINLFLWHVACSNDGHSMLLTSSICTHSSMITLIRRTSIYIEFSVYLVDSHALIIIYSASRLPQRRAGESIMMYA